MPQTALVTIYCNNSCQDFSLPLNQPISSWIDALIQAAAGESSENMQLVYQDTALLQSCSLADYAIWDGAVLSLRRNG